MSALGGFGLPGHGAIAETVEREILWGRDDQHLPILYKNYVVSSATRDAGNSPTTDIRRGLLMGVVADSGEIKEWDADASDGTQNIAAVLNCSLNILDPSATAVDRVPLPPLVAAPVIASRLLIQGSAFVGHVDEYLARRTMHAMGFRFDDDPQGYKAGAVERYALVTGTTDALTADENGTVLFYNNAASVTVTLPAIKPGLHFDLVRVGDEEFVVTSAEGDNMVHGNDLSGDSITWTTASQHLGARLRVQSVYIGTALKWLAALVPPPFGDGTALLAHTLAT